MTKLQPRSLEKSKEHHVCMSHAARSTNEVMRSLCSWVGEGGLMLRFVDDWICMALRLCDTVGAFGHAEYISAFEG